MEGIFFLPARSLAASQFLEESGAGGQSSQVWSVFVTAICRIGKQRVAPMACGRDVGSSREGVNFFAFLLPVSKRGTCLGWGQDAWVPGVGVGSQECGVGGLCSEGENNTLGCGGVGGVGQEGQERSFPPFLALGTNHSIKIT